MFSCICVHVIIANGGLVQELKWMDRKPDSFSFSLFSVYCLCSFFHLACSGSIRPSVGIHVPPMSMASNAGFEKGGSVFRFQKESGR
jgi:hypothetical protein